MTLSIANREVGPIGFGMMRLTQGSISTDEAITILKTALDAGANFWNAGHIYGSQDYNSLHLLNAYFSKHPQDADRVVVSVKACFDLATASVQNDAEGVKRWIDRCLEILDGKVRISVFQPCRLDPDTPIEITVGAIAEYAKAGKIGGVGLSECSATSIRKAAKVYPLAAVEVEVSLFATDIFTNGIAEACRELGVPIVAYGPLGGGFLSGQFRKHEDLPASDFRHMFPRWAPEVFDENMKMVHAVERIAKAKGCTTAQVAIAWVAEQSNTIGVPVIPIPGASTSGRALENTAKLTELTQQDFDDLKEIVANIKILGSRSPQKFAKFMEV